MRESSKKKNSKNINSTSEFISMSHQYSRIFPLYKRDFLLVILHFLATTTKQSCNACF